MTEGGRQALAFYGERMRRLLDSVSVSRPTLTAHDTSQVIVQIHPDTRQIAPSI